MLIIPAIDIIDGQCVRLFQGKYDQATRYSLNPVDVAGTYDKAGALWIHLVDLDGARGKGRNNRATIKAIREAVRCRIETGGGIRTEKDIEELLSIGVDKLILGTVLIKEPERVSGWINQYGNVFAAGIDALNGQVKVSGWEAGAGMQDTVLAAKAEKLGLSGIIYTSISRDGTFTGPDIRSTNKIAGASSLPVILSAGIGSRADVEKVSANRAANIKGLIVGKAIYEDKVDIKELLTEYQTEKADRDSW
jgi:phosphoribosylformimino-5-aminoimidazole carboxamide ribotide isomerase